MNTENPEIERSRIRQVFRYLEALNQLRNAPKRLIHEQPWVLWFRDISQHDSIRKGTIGDVQQSESASDGNVTSTSEDLVLKVCRPKTTQPPIPPEMIKSWLNEGWEQIDGNVEVFPSKNEVASEGQTIIIRFEDNPERPRILDSWKRLRDEWARNERPAREALKLFEKLYELKGQIEREGERVELILGDGVLNWRRAEGGVNHPILLKRLQLEFNPNIPEFTLTETGHPTELYSALFRTMSEVGGGMVGRFRDELEKGSYHPLGGDDTSGFLRRIVAQLHANGQFVGFDQLQGEQDFPRIIRSPVIFMRNRNLGFANALDAVLDDIKKRTDFPHSLVNIVGIEVAPRDVDSCPSTKWMGNGNENVEILLSKPVNVEQLHIAERLSQYGCVVVQGPPGTGKTHTIGNLVGHLLAEGKSVLVTSHTTKALRVLREKVADPLQPLCVSVLESDLDSRKQLESSVSKIVERLASASLEELDNQAAWFRNHRNKIIEQLTTARKELLASRSSEYDEIVIAGKAYSPSEAARLVAREVARHSWIPGPVYLREPMPLSKEELTELYRTNINVPFSDQMELERELPELDTLFHPEQFRQFVDEQTKLEHEDKHLYESYWNQISYSQNILTCSYCGSKNNIPKESYQKKICCSQCKRLLSQPNTKDCNVDDANRIEEILETSNRILNALSQNESWCLAVIWAGQAGGTHRIPWDNFITETGIACQMVVEAQEILLKVGPIVPEEFNSEDGLSLLNEIFSHLMKGGSLSWWTNLTKPRWKTAIAKLKVSGKPPHSEEHFKALIIAIEISIKRTALRTRWERQMVPLGAPAAEKLGDQPEFACKAYAEILTDCLDWHAKSWKPLLKELEEIGLLWDKVLKAIPPKTSKLADIERMLEAARTKLPEILRSRLASLKWESNEQAFHKLQCKFLRTTREESKVINTLAEAVRQRDPAKYETAYGRLAEILGRRQTLDRRHALLKKLDTVAPTWATMISHRQAPHATDEPPGNAEDAWLWRQLNDILDAHSKISPEDIQQKIDSLNDALKHTTTELIDRLAWAAQARRTTLQQRQALMGWEQVIRRIGKGTGKRVVRLEAEARSLMDKCRTAVPVWIMPLTRVVDNFNPASTRFDVVIIDEASQCDVMALIALYMAKQVVIVGDHEQVSPDAVGQNVSEVQHLIDEHLTGIPNANLYDGQLSIYDLARQSFGGLLSLKEHFRCMGEIIQFSNHLSYNGTIRPLRDSASTILRPFVLEHRLDGVREDKINMKEAFEIASLIVAAIEQPEYENKTFGVISLLGEEQAREIEQLLRHHLSPTDFEQRRIVCGNAAHFQGDERDIMFLSIVDSPMDGPLPLREQPLFKKRFNVAASRAKDQMWVVHSLRPEVDLKPGDLRRRLIEYAHDPNAIIRLLEQQEKKTESEFERLVIRYLISCGYNRVVPQWKVGHYRIDMVVSGKDGRKLAIECDGDRFHPPEKLVEDMQRQEVLERLGWHFVRIRGSQFFRDQEQTMKPVFERLRSLDIEPDGQDGEKASEEIYDTELQARLVRRAAELRRQWKTDPDVETELPAEP